MSNHKKHTLTALAATAALLTATAIGGTAFAAKDCAEQSRIGKRDQMHHHQAKGKRMFHRDMMMRERLNEADSDGDGKVTMAEIKTKQEANLAKYDTNNDGQLSLEEYKPLWIERHNRRIVRSFQFLDANGNGQVSDAEFRRVIDWVVARMDRDEDGAISKDDFKRRHR